MLVEIITGSADIRLAVAELTQASVAAFADEVAKIAALMIMVADGAGGYLCNETLSTQWAGENRTWLGPAVFSRLGLLAI